MDHKNRTPVGLSRQLTHFSVETLSSRLDTCVCVELRSDNKVFHCCHQRISTLVQVSSLTVVTVRQDISQPHVAKRFPVTLWCIVLLVRRSLSRVHVHTTWRTSHGISRCGLDQLPSLVHWFGFVLFTRHSSRPWCR